MNCKHVWGNPIRLDGLCIDCWKARAHFLEAEIDTRKRAHRENEAAFQQMQERAKKAEAERDAAIREIRIASERMAKAEAACAEMRRTVILLDAHITGEAYIKYSQAINHALSTDVGKGWLSPQEAEKRYTEWRMATEELKKQLSVEFKRLEAKLAIAVEALETISGQSCLLEHPDGCVCCFSEAPVIDMADEALSKLKEDKA